MDVQSGSMLTASVTHERFNCEIHFNFNCSSKMWAVQFQPLRKTQNIIKCISDSDELEMVSPLAKMNVSSSSVHTNCIAPLLDRKWLLLTGHIHLITHSNHKGILVKKDWCPPYIVHLNGEYTRKIQRWPRSITMIVKFTCPVRAKPSSKPGTNDLQNTLQQFI